MQKFVIDKKKSANLYEIVIYSISIILNAVLS